MGFEERDCVRMDGSGSYQDKAKEGNANEGLWIASPAGTPLAEAEHIYWFESAYDAMAYYQLHQAQNQELRKAVFVSTGGSPTVAQMQGVFLPLFLPGSISVSTPTSQESSMLKIFNKRCTVQCVPPLRRPPNVSLISTLFRMAKIWTVERWNCCPGIC